VGLIRRKIIDASINPSIFRFARDAVRDIPEHDELGEIGALIDAIRSRVSYRRDPVGIETIADAHDTLEIGAGDCDDLTVLAGGALQSLGYPVEIELVGDRRLSHVRPIAKTKKYGKIPVDLARPDGRFTSTNPIFPMKVTVPVGMNQTQARKAINKMPKFQRQALMKRAQAAGTNKAGYLVRQASRPLKYALPTTSARTLRDIAAGSAGFFTSPEPVSVFEDYPRMIGTGSNPAGDDGIGSWLSEGIKKVVGKKAGKAIEKGANTLGRTAVSATASFIPGGNLLLPMIESTYSMGANPAKMSDASLARLAQTDPAGAQAIMQQKELLEATNKIKKMPKNARVALHAAAQARGMTKAQYYVAALKGQVPPIGSVVATAAAVEAQQAAAVSLAPGGYPVTAEKKPSMLLPLLGVAALAYKFM